MCVRMVVGTYKSWQRFCHLISFELFNKLRLLYSPKWWVNLATSTTMEVYLFKWLLLASSTTERLRSFLKKREVGILIMIWDGFGGLKSLQRYNILSGFVHITLFQQMFVDTTATWQLHQATPVAHPLWKIIYTAYVITLIPRSGDTQKNIEGAL